MVKAMKQSLIGQRVLLTSVILLLSTTFSESKLPPDAILLTSGNGSSSGTSMYERILYWVDWLKPICNLSWQIFTLLFYFWIGLFLLMMSFDYLERICSKGSNDFTQVYSRGLKKILYLLLIVLPVALWIAVSFFIGKVISMFEGSDFLWIFVVLVPMPFMVALYFPIFRSIKREVFTKDLTKVSSLKDI